MIHSRLILKGLPSKIWELETPCLLIDQAKLLRNLNDMRLRAETGGVTLRPHIKTHKSIDIAKLQIEIGGANGICTSKPDEALVFIQAGFKDITVAFPIIDPRKLDRVLLAARSNRTEMSFIADSEAIVEEIGNAAIRAGVRPSVFMKVDVGLHRVGVEPTHQKAVSVATAIDRHKALNFGGLLSHAGHAYAATNQLEIEQIAECERMTMLELADKLKGAGIAVQKISVGSTPSVLATNSFKGLNEIRPGNYVFMDATAMRLGVASLDQVSFSVLSTVVSRNNSFAIIDAGSKVLSSDKGPHGTGADGFGLAYVDDLCADPFQICRLSEEHGWIAHRGFDLSVGTKVRIVPNHSCVVANLVGQAWVVKDTSIVDQWTFEANSKVL
ncbi:MAG: alanine racemase [Pseudomonadota bacterium]